MACKATTTADGSRDHPDTGPDPRFGMQAAFPSALTDPMPSGLTSSLAMTRTVTLSDPTNSAEPHQPDGHDHRERSQRDQYL